MDVYACSKCVLIKCHLLGQEGFIAGLLTLYHFHVVLTVCKITYEIYIQTKHIEHLWQIRGSHILSVKIMDMWEKSARQVRTTKKGLKVFVWSLHASICFYLFLIFYHPHSIKTILTDSNIYISGAGDFIVPFNFLRTRPINKLLVIFL